MKKIIVLFIAICLFLPLFGCSKSVKVEFFANGQSLGTVSGKSPLDVSEQAPIIETSTYKFYGWVDQDGCLFDLGEPIEKDMVLTAKLVPIYTVYWVNEGEIVAQQQYEEGELLEKPELDIPQSKTDHYVFDKWMLNDVALPADLKVENDLKISASYKYTSEFIYFSSNPLVIYGSNAEVRSGINHNLVGTEHVKITSSDPSIATYYDTHIFTHGIGECTFRVESKSGLVKFLTVIVKEK